MCSDTAPLSCYQYRNGNRELAGNRREKLARRTTNSAGYRIISPLKRADLHRLRPGCKYRFTACTGVIEVDVNILPDECDLLSHRCATAGRSSFECNRNDI